MTPDVGAGRFAVHPVNGDVALDARHQFVGDHAQRGSPITSRALSFSASAS